MKNVPEVNLDARQRHILMQALTLESLSGLPVSVSWMFLAYLSPLMSFAGFSPFWK
jgi:hypothetical protein